jgi:molecular chaperone IbpA
LTITGELGDKDNGFVHQGISQRKFSRNFVLAEDVLVKGADLSNGILTVYAERVIPEEKKARTVEIGKVSKTTKKQFLAE